MSQTMKIPLLIAAALLVAAAPSASPHYAVAGSISGPDGGWDYAHIDSTSHRLYIARSDAVTVVDLDKGATIASWGPIARGHAVVPLPGNRLLVTSGNDASVRFLDATDGHQLASVAVGKKPDAAIYDDVHKRAFVMNATGGSISVLDTIAMRVTATIAVKPSLEFAVLAKDGTLFVNNEEGNEVEVIDLAHGTVTSSIAMTGCDGPTGLGYDANSNRLISACSSGKAIVISAATRRVVGSIDIGKGADAVIVDDARHLAFIPCGADGVLEMLSLTGPTIARIGRVTTEVGARTGALDPATGAIYLPTARFGPPTAGSKRPPVLPGTFHILKVTKS